MDAALQAGDRRGAQALAEAAVREGLEHPALFRLAGLALIERAAADEAVVFLRRGLQLNPADAEAWRLLGVALLRLDRLVQAVAAARAAVAHAPDNADALFSLAEALATSGENQEAATAYARCIAVSPNAAAPRAALATLQARIGDAELARGHAEAALALQPGNLSALTALAEVELRQKNYPEAARRLNRLLQGGGLAPMARAITRSKLGDALHGQGRHAEAGDVWTAANRDLHDLQAAAYAPAAEVSTRALDTLIDTLESGATARWAPTPPAPSGPARRHVFLMGFIRSGTTVAEQVLAGHPQVVALDERPTLAAAEQALVFAADAPSRLANLDAAEADRLRDLYWRTARTAGADPDGKVFVDKSPLNCLNLPLIARLFPDARIVFARRDPRDVVLSCWRRLFRANVATFQLLSLEGAARLYDRAMRLSEAARATLPLTWHELRYEALVGDFETELSNLAAFLDLDLDAAVAKAMKDVAGRPAGGEVDTPSAIQLRQGLFDGSGQWRPYADRLAPVMPILQPWIDRFGYS